MKQQFATWAPVIVTDEASEHHGRAGTVRAFDDENYTVMLDETATHEAGEVLFAVEQLRGL